MINQGDTPVAALSHIRARVFQPAKPFKAMFAISLPIRRCTPNAHKRAETPAQQAMRQLLALTISASTGRALEQKVKHEQFLQKMVERRNARAQQHQGVQA